MTEPSPESAPEGARREEAFEEHELDAMEENTPFRAPAIFEVVRRQGESELARPALALMLSGLIAGLALGLSVMSEALFRTHLPDAGWRPLVESLGYSVGFVVVILGQMQLFTENTITAVCPALDARDRKTFLRLGRLWALVFATNLIGASIFGYVLHVTRAYQPDVWAAVRDIAGHAVSYGWTETMFRGVGAGWLIATLVWIMPNAGNSKTLMIILITWLIALGEFAHVIAGATEAAFLVFAGDRTAAEALFGFVAPALIGNILGGTVFFTVLTWAQIRAEHWEDSPERRDAARRNRTRR
ncbi:formate/nitrite transporter family protein [Pikeienuella sp. HZG-20]|uniref:formate/nitrite transporter family protein n=1 Tax=Paludibacillus litoralis TaxID=3133267 RepID=UPI0030EE11AC